MMKSKQKQYITKCMQVTYSLEWCEKLLAEFSDETSLEQIKSIRKIYSDKAFDSMRNSNISEIEISPIKNRTVTLKIKNESLK